MHSKWLLIAAQLFLVFACHADAAIVAAGPFVGDFQEGFESNQASVGFGTVQAIAGFAGHATIRNTTPPNGYLHTGTGWGGGQLGGTVLAKEGRILLAHINSPGFTEITFDTQIDSFGGYFNSLFTSSPSTIQFYDGANLLSSININVGYGQWIWQGWSTTAGESFDRVVIDHSAQQLGATNWYLLDDLQATSAETVPEPATLTIWGLGVLGCAFAAYRRKRQAA